MPIQAYSLISLKHCMAIYYLRDNTMILFIGQAIYLTSNQTINTFILGLVYNLWSL